MNEEVDIGFVLKIAVCSLVIGWCYSLTIKSDINSLEREVSHQKILVSFLQKEITELKYRKQHD
ncbi:hypothetical protein [Methylobacter sp.]|uniref:hypothetical protein n=1 Tax=Methylobacter sp. TaxID=2051955 RepID=UPI003DA34E66